MPTRKPQLPHLLIREAILSKTDVPAPPHGAFPETLARPGGVVAGAVLPADPAAEAGRVVGVDARVVVPGDPALLRVPRQEGRGGFAVGADVVGAVGVVVAVVGADGIAGARRVAGTAPRWGGQGEGWEWGSGCRCGWVLRGWGGGWCWC